MNDQRTETAVERATRIIGDRLKPWKLTTTPEFVPSIAAWRVSYSGRGTEFTDKTFAVFGGEDWAEQTDVLGTIMCYGQKLKLSDRLRPKATPVRPSADELRMIEEAKVAGKTPEEIYDAEIAPALLRVMQRCQELGFPMVASVEWERREHQRGRTEFCPDLNGEQRPTAAQLLVHYAARCNGNLDAMLVAVMRDARQHGHSSAYLQMLGVPTSVSPQPTQQT